jgi:fucose 4-O-acetylase-like acetyltransferase
VRLGLILLGFAFTVAFLLLMPRRTTWFTSLGAATMYIYLLHSFLLFPLRETGVLEGPQPWWMLPAMILLSIAISVALSIPFVLRFFHPLVQPKAKWLFRRQEPVQTGAIPVPPGDQPK